MTTRTISSAATSTPQLFPYIQRSTTTIPFKQEVPSNRNSSSNVFSWEQLSSGFPLVHLLQPDYYMVFQFSAPGVPVY